jgi:ATP/maltotriose-dependent transcriptional regulator MalT
MFAANVLPRTRLLAQLTDALRAGHVLLEAPGGYDKTNLPPALAREHPRFWP